MLKKDVGFGLHLFLSEAKSTFNMINYGSMENRVGLSINQADR